MFTKEVWVAAITGADFPDRTNDDVAGLVERHDEAAAAWLAAVRDIERRDAWDDRVVDALCDPPESFVLGSIVAHVITYSAAPAAAGPPAARPRTVSSPASRSTRPACPATAQLDEEAPMTRTTFYTAMTLDGFLADEHDSLDWLFVQDQDEKGPLNYDEFIKDIGAMVMGATTYEWILRPHRRDGESRGPTTCPSGW